MRFFLLLLLAGVAGPGKTPVQSAPPSWSSKSNPVNNDDQARRAGAKLFSRECASCHGANAQGIGRALPLRQPEVYKAAPGVLFWVLKNGSIYRGMPSFAHLPEPQRWQIVTFLRSLNAPPKAN
jgi:mono/diheme cytochrome c family protein